MDEYLIQFKDWITELGEEHNVDPLTLGVLYLISKVSFVTFLGIMVKRLRAKKDITMPMVFAALSFCVPYTYFIIFGRNISIWAYLLIGATFAFGVFRMWKKLREKSPVTPDDVMI